MVDSVETDHTGGGVPDSPAVCASSHDANDDSDTLCEDEDEVEQFSTLSGRTPTVQRVIDEIKLLALVKTLVEHSPAFTDANHDTLFFPEMWQEIHSKIIAAISASAVTVEKEAKKAALEYVKECAAIDTYAASLVDHKAFSSISISDLSVRRNVSLLLQLICMEYIEAFGNLIAYSCSDGPTSIRDKVSRAFSHATTSRPDELFPRSKVMKNAYYLIGFIGNQAHNYTKRMAKGSGRQVCMQNFDIWSCTSKGSGLKVQCQFVPR